MIKIEISNASSKVYFDDAETRATVSEILSYFVEGSVFSGNSFWDGRVRLLSRRNTFPTGLLAHLLKGLNKAEIKAQVKDLRTKVPRGKEKFVLIPKIEWRPHQKDSIRITMTETRGVVVLGTGGGKSILSVGIVATKQTQTLIITPDVGLREQLLETYVWAFGEKFVGNCITQDKPIIVANIQSLMNKKEKLFHRFKMLLIDEFHHAASNSYLTVNDYCINAFWRYGFTGTFTRSDGVLMGLFGVLSETIYKKSTSELIEEGWLVRPEITITRYEVAAKRLNYREAYKFITSDLGINEFIARAVRDKLSENKQTLVLVKFKEHGRLLHSLIGDCIFLSGDDDMDYRNKVKAAFNARKIRCIVATNIFGEGQDIPSIEVLFNARFEKTEIQTKQALGRTLRLCKGKEKALIYDFLIIGNKHLKNHSVERLKTYMSEPAFKINVKKHRP